MLKLKVSIRLSRDIISAHSVFSTVARRTHGNQSRKQPQRRQQQRQQRQIGKRAQEWRPERVTEATYHPTRPNVPENRGSRTVGGSRASIAQGDKVARRDGPMRTTPRQILRPNSKLTTLHSGGAEADATPVTL